MVGPFFQSLRRELKNNAWDSVTAASLADSIRNALVVGEFSRAMEASVTAGTKGSITVHQVTTVNRVSSQALERKNALNTVSALRTVVTQNSGNTAKGAERADLMRRVHPTYLGYICVAQSADTGEIVGMRKQLALTAGVCLGGDVLPLKRHLLADPAVTPLDAVGDVVGRVETEDLIGKIFSTFCLGK